MLKSDTSLSFSEKTEGVVKFCETVSAYELGVLVTWLQAGLLKMPQDETLAITVCITSVIAADYLGMLNMDGFVEDVAECFKGGLVANRTALAVVNLQLMEQ